MNIFKLSVGVGGWGNSKSISLLTLGIRHPCSYSYYQNCKTKRKHRYYRCWSYIISVGLVTIEILVEIPLTLLCFSLIEFLNPHQILFFHISNIFIKNHINSSWELLVVATYIMSSLIIDISFNSKLVSASLLVNTISVSIPLVKYMCPIMLCLMKIMSSTNFSFITLSCNSSKLFFIPLFLHLFSIPLDTSTLGSNFSRWFFKSNFDRSH